MIIRNISKTEFCIIHNLIILKITTQMNVLSYLICIFALRNPH